MTKKEKEELEELAVAGLFVLFLIWLLYNLLHGSQPNVGSPLETPVLLTPNAAPTTAAPATLTLPGITPPSPSPLSPTLPTGSCCTCSGPGCPVNPNVIPPLNTILANAAAVQNAIYAAGDNTFAALEAIQTQTNPLVQVTQDGVGLITTAQPTIPSNLPALPPGEYYQG